MKASATNHNAKSIFSVNTHLSSHQPQSASNSLLSFYRPLFKEHANDYPDLSKILFLQLILRQNLLLYTHRRVELKQLWLSINKRLSVQNGNIFLIDEHFKIEELYAINSEYRRVMLYDLSKASNISNNYLINHPLHDVSLVNIEHQNAIIKTEISDMFSYLYVDEKELNFEGFINKIHEKDVQDLKKEEKFNKQLFNDAISFNFNQTIETKEEEGFFKTYLIRLKQQITSESIMIPHSKWKKMIKMLQFIGLTKHEGFFKRLTLSDCCLAPHLLSQTQKQLQIIQTINEKVIIEMLPYFGIQKFMKSLKDHFWISDTLKRYYLSLSEKIRNTVSYFYPCSKYPETMQIQTQNQQIFYRVNGYDKKLMSDKYYEIDQENRKRQYVLRLKYKNSCKAVTHFGIACYDSNKNLIAPVQVCRYEDTDVVVQKVLDNKIYVVQDQTNLEHLRNWHIESPLNENNEGHQGVFAYERCIGIYNDGNLQKMLTLEEIMLSEKDSYSQEKQKGVYQSIGQNYIELSEEGSKILKSMKNLIKNNTSKLVNHYEGGTYSIAKTQNQHVKQWKAIALKFQHMERKNNGTSFLYGTHFIRIILMINFNSGYPHFTLQNKNASVDIKQIQWSF